MAIPHILLLSGNQQKKTVAGYVGSSSGMTPRAEVIRIMIFVMIIMMIIMIK